MTAHAPMALPAATEAQRSSQPALLRVELLSDGDEVAPLWQAIEAATGVDAITTSWAWTESWLHCFGDVVPHRFAIAYAGDVPCGAALITRGARQRVGPLPVRTVHLGTAGEPPGEGVRVEYNRLLVLPQFRTEFAARLLEIIRHELAGWDKLELDGFAPDDAELLLGLEPSFRAIRQICNVADLAAARAGDGDIIRALKKNVAAKIQKNRRRFEERFGPISATWITDPAEAWPVFDELVALHQSRWTAAGYPGSFASARFLRFHREIIERLLPAGRVVLYRAKAGEQVLGIFYGFVDGGVIYHYQWGLARFEEKSLSPGFVVGALCMQEALERGYDELNWLAGDVRYKRELSTATRELVWAEWHRGPWMATVDALIAARRWAREHSARFRREREGHT